MTDATIIAQTTSWIKTVVIGCNFCPFAAKVMRNKRIRYVVVQQAKADNAISTLVQEMELLANADDVETTLIILPQRFEDFITYLDLVRSAEKTVARKGYEGVYQIASFHPVYCFAGADVDDPANYTNRSPYPMLQILREASISHAVDNYEDADKIPQHNIAFAQQKGLAYMKMLLEACVRQ